MKLKSTDEVCKHNNLNFVSSDITPWRNAAKKSAIILEIEMLSKAAQKDILKFAKGSALMSTASL